MLAKDKNYNIQILRGLAIIAVVVIHTCPSGVWQVWCRPFVNYAVALFLFLSGYLTNIENDNWAGFFMKRIIRVIIPYFVWCIFYSLINKSPSLKTICYDLLTTKSSAILYYIFVYIQFVLLTPLLGKLAKSKYSWIGWCVAPVSVLLLSYPQVVGISINKYVLLLYSISCLGWMSFYYMGLMLGNGLLKRNYELKRILPMFCLSVVLQIIEGYIWMKQGVSNCGSQLKLTSLLTSSLFLIVSYLFIKGGVRQFKSKILIVLGNYSFGIYLCHIAFIKILTKLSHSIIPFPITTIIVILVSALFVHFSNKILGERISRWIGFR